MSTSYSGEVLKKKIYDDLCRGCSQTYLVKMLNTDGYGVGHTLGKNSAKSLITKVRAIMRADFQAEKPEMREVMLARLFDLFKESKDSNDRQTALKVLQEINKVTGLYEPTKIDANVNQSITIDFNLGNQDEC